jgi:hypothetical protein
MTCFQDIEDISVIYGKIDVMFWRLLNLFTFKDVNISDNFYINL